MGLTKASRQKGGWSELLLLFFSPGRGAENYYYVEADLFSGLVAGTAAVDELSGQKGPGQEFTGRNSLRRLI